MDSSTTSSDEWTWSLIVTPLFSAAGSRWRNQLIFGRLAFLPDRAALSWPIPSLSCVSLSRYAHVGERPGGT